MKDLYVILISALLNYKKPRKYLEDMDFKINQYDPCIANKVINGSQMTVTWNVDDLKITHKDSREINFFILLRGEVNDEGITITRGKVHSYLVMDF